MFLINGRSVSDAEARDHYIRYAVDDLCLDHEQAKVSFHAACRGNSEHLDYLGMSGVEIQAEQF